jgi:hypothetical protein
LLWQAQVAVAAVLIQVAAVQVDYAVEQKAA